MKRIYLAGPIQADPINATDWREYLVKELSQIGWIGIIPPGMLVVDLEKSVEELRGWIRSGNWDKFNDEMRKVEEGDIGALKACQAMVIYLPDENSSSWGTKGEVYYAYYEMDIPIYLIYPRPISTGSFWLIHTVRNRQVDTKDREVIFRTFPDFVKYLKERAEK